MAKLYKTPACEADLYDIWNYIAADNRTAANRFLQRLESRFQALLTQPEMGERQDRFRAGLRSVVEGSYIIFYEAAGADITVHRVIHGARQWEQLI